LKYIFAIYLSYFIYSVKFFLHIFILVCIVAGKPASAQNCLEDVWHRPLYSGFNDIINGTKWIYEKKYLGSPMLMEDYWPRADIEYNGEHYEGIVMNYDVYHHELVIYHPEKGKEKYIVITMDKLSGFTFTDSVTRRSHVYEYRELPGIRGKFIYENAGSGQTSLYIRPAKIIDAGSSGGQGEFSSIYEYYLGIGDRYTVVRSQRQMIKVLASHENELIRFIRKSKLKIDDRHPDNMIALINFFDGLK
jgi:hypothetical protein